MTLFERMPEYLGQVDILQTGPAIRQHDFISLPIEPIKERLGRTELNQWILEAEASSNALQHLIVSENSETGQELLESFDNPKLIHHGHRHSAHVEAAVKRLIRESDKTEGMPKLSENMVRALLLFGDFHDWDQQTLGLHNLKNPNDPQVHERAGHEMGAAVKILTLAPEYAEVSGLDNCEAEKVVKLAALIIMRHDHQSSAHVYEDWLINPIGVGPNAAVYNHDRLYRNLDITKLSPRQCIEILQLEKQRAGTMDKLNTTYGLSKAFEESKYGQRLHDFMQNDAKSMDPLFEDLDDITRAELRHATAIAEIADVTDMVAPYWESTLRMIDTYYSRKRPFMRFVDLNDAYWAERDEKYFPGKFSLDTTRNSIDISDFSPIMSEKGDETVTDVERCFWEYNQLLELASASGLGNIDFLKKFMFENISLGINSILMLAFSMVGDAKREASSVQKSMPMKGTIELIDNYFDERIEALYEREGVSAEDPGLREVERRIDEEREATKISLMRKFEPFQTQAQVAIEGLDFAKNRLLAFAKFFSTRFLHHKTGEFDLNGINDGKRLVGSFFGKPSLTQSELYDQDPYPRKPLKVTPEYYYGRLFDEAERN